MFLLGVAKLWKIIEKDLLEHVPPGSSKWASPIVVVRKSDGDIHICGNYKIGVDHKVCSDSYPIPNVEVALHALARMSVFTKRDLKTAYHQIPINNNDKYGKWKRMPYGIKTASRIFQRAIE